LAGHRQSTERTAASVSESSRLFFEKWAAGNFSISCPLATPLENSFAFGKSTGGRSIGVIGRSQKNLFFFPKKIHFLLRVVIKNCNATDMTFFDRLKSTLSYIPHVVVNRILRDSRTLTAPT
jgi:hypothetical protein